MVIVRESPHSKKYSSSKPDDTSQPWPPKSPFQALLSSPSGRKKYEQRFSQRDGSPSPTKAGAGRLGNGSESDDEETLHLKLQAIEAKLKLKKLAQAKKAAASSVGDVSSGRSSQLESITSRPSTSASLRNIGARDSELRSRVQVPVSPTKSLRQQATGPPSPARVVLGIDKGLRAQDVSLKRAASTRANAVATGGSSLARSNSHKAVLQSSRFNRQPQEKPKSFGERILEARNQEKELKSKHLRIQNARTKGFELDATVDLSTPSGRPMSSGTPYRESRQQSLKALPRQSSLPERKVLDTVASPGDEESVRESSRQDQDLLDNASLEPYSGFHLNKRKMDHNTLTRLLKDRKVYSIPKLLKEVKSPDYEPPDCECDYVVMGIIGYKSNPKETRGNPSQTINSYGTEGRPKFMVLKLTDLKWEVDLFLFDTGFNKFWKLPVGTVIGILNPSILPPKKKDSGAFSLKVASSDDTVLEIGSSKHIGFCSAVKRDGDECRQWVNGRKTSICEFHMNLKVEQARKGRMELSGLRGMPGGSRSRGRGGPNGKSKNKPDFEDDQFRINGTRAYDKVSGETAFIASKELKEHFGLDVTRFLDDHDADANAWSRGCSKEEWRRKKKLEEEKEVELARKLSAQGRGAGAEYLKAKVEGAKALDKRNEQQSDSDDVFAPQTNSSARFLGLMAKKASDVSLAPLKRKRGGAHAAEPMGWGGAYKKGLLSPSKAERKESGEHSPKKKARFILAEKGIREPGRESLSVTVAQKQAVCALEDDDDDLEIV